MNLSMDYQMNEYLNKRKENNNNNNTNNNMNNNTNNNNNQELEHSLHSTMNSMNSMLNNSLQQQLQQSQYGNIIQNSRYDSEFYVYEVEFKRGKEKYEKSVSCREDFDIGDFVRVESERGYEIGVIANRIVQSSSSLPFFSRNGTQTLRKIISRAADNEKKILLMKLRDESRALHICNELAARRKLPILILDAEFQSDRNKLTFLYISDVRVDFRELVRDLFSLFKTRIWMQKLDINGKQIHSSLPSGDPNGPPVLPQLTHLTARYGRSDLTTLTYPIESSPSSSSPPLSSLNDKNFNDLFGNFNSNNNNINGHGNNNININFDDIENLNENENLLNWSHLNQISELEASAEPYIPQNYQLYEDNFSQMHPQTSISNMNGQSSMSRYEYETKKSNNNIQSKQMFTTMRNSSPPLSSSSTLSSQYMQPNQMYSTIQNDMEQPVQDDRMFYEAMYGSRKDISSTSYNLPSTKNNHFAQYPSNNNNINNNGYLQHQNQQMNMNQFNQLNNNSSSNNYNMNYYHNNHSHQQQQSQQQHHQLRSDLIDEEFYTSTSRPPLPFPSDSSLSHHQQYQNQLQHQQNNYQSHYSNYGSNNNNINNNNHNSNYLDHIAPSYSRSSDSNFSDIIIPDEHLFGLDTSTTSGPFILE